MASLESILGARLEKMRRNADGTFQARCPVCAASGADKTGEHLRIFGSGAFNCVVAGKDPAHNKGIRAFIYAGADEATLLQLAVSIVDPEPKLDIDPVYPEDLVAKLVQDHHYWVGRGISEEVLRKLEGGMYPAEMRGKMEGRYCFPVRHHQTRRVMGWTGRLVSDASFGPKHKHLVKSSRAVFPLTANRDSILRTKKLVLLEGVGDGLACSTVGITNWLLLLGLNLNSNMLGFIMSAALDEVIISTNNDAIADGAGSRVAGNGAAEKIRAKLVPYLGEDKVRIRLPETRKDWCATLEDKTGELDVFRAEVMG